MDFIEALPHVNASLNGLATLLLVVGFVLIKKRRVEAHKKAMLGAFGMSTLFLVFYLIYHGNAGSKPFPRTDYATWIAVCYYVILFTHVVLAVAVPPLTISSIYLGFRDRREKHKKVVRWTFPIWLYVSITGVIVYFMLYILFPPLKAP